MLQVVDYVINSEDRFEELINLFLAGPYRITQRSAWPLSHCVQRRPALIKSHIGKVLRFISTPDAPVAARRNVMRLLQFVEIQKRYHAQAINLCFDFLTSAKEPVAVKVFSMTVLAGLARKNPELKRELEIVIEDQLPYATAAFRSRARRLVGGKRYKV